MSLFKKNKKQLTEVKVERPPYEAGFLPLEDLKSTDALRANIGTFKRANCQVMCFTNNEGDPIKRGELIGFHIFPCGNAHPVVRMENGEESVWMGFVLPLWEELFEFLQQQESCDRFWKMASIMHGWSGLHRFDQIVSKKMKRW